METRGSNKSNATSTGMNVVFFTAHLIRKGYTRPAAVIQVLTDRRQLTPDLGGTGTTATVTDEVVAELGRS
jgi:isocitrate/isopropylmalate dehydrogenase